MSNILNGNKLISIDRLDKSDNTIKYSEKEFFDENPLEKALQNKYVPKAGDRIYIYPDSNVPRFKLKKFCEKYNTSVAKAKETANVFFMDPEVEHNSENFYTKHRYGDFMYKSYFLDFIKRSTRVGDVRYMKLINDLANNNEELVYISDTYNFEQYGLNKYKLDFVQPGDTDDNDVELVPNCIQSKDLFYCIENQEQQKNFAFLVGKDYYHTNAILALLNDDAIIDEEMYEGICNLFESSDRADTKVAMEAMANCDYNKSAAYLLMIFYAHQNDIYNSDTKHHVNFKSFLKYFDLSASRSIDIDDVINKLKSKKLLTTPNLNLVMKKAKELMDERMETITEYFKPVGIEPVDSIKNEVADTDALNAPVQEIQITDL